MNRLTFRFAARLALVSTVTLATFALGEGRVEHRLNLRNMDGLCVYVTVALDGEIDWATGNEVRDDLLDKAELYDLPVDTERCREYPNFDPALLKATLTIDGLTTNAGVVYMYEVEGQLDTIFVSYRDGAAQGFRKFDSVLVFEDGGYGIVPASGWDDKVRGNIEDLFDSFALEFKRQYPLEY